MSTTIAGPPTALRSPPRLTLSPTRADRAVLDGGWWPRSWDAAAEVPGLVEALSARYGPIRHVMLSSAAWDGGARRLAVGDRTIRMGWFASQDVALAIAITDRDDQIDLLVVPPTAPAAAAEQAMTAAADPADARHAADLLATLPTAPAQAAGAAEDRRAVWNGEGGSVGGDGSATPAAGLAETRPV